MKRQNNPVKKKAVSLLLSAAVLFTPAFSGVSAVAAEPDALTQTAREAEYSGTCGENLTWTLEDGLLTISGTGAMANYAGWSSDAPWYDMRDTIISIVIQNSVFNIGQYAFDGCVNLTSITIPRNVIRIGEFAFSGCSNLTDIYYIGTQAQWNIVAKDNAGIPDGTVIHCKAADDVPASQVKEYTGVLEWSQQTLGDYDLLKQHSVKNSWCEIMLGENAEGEDALVVSNGKGGYGLKPLSDILPQQPESGERWTGVSSIQEIDDQIYIVYEGSGTGHEYGLLITKDGKGFQNIRMTFPDDPYESGEPEWRSLNGLSKYKDTYLLELGPSVQGGIGDIYASTDLKT